MSDIINDPVLVSPIQDLARGIKSEADLTLNFKTLHGVFFAEPRQEAA